ncbi:MAG: NifB/NifX family molybdenum-iron cluster-binding protein [Methanomicrobiales archaeon]
MKIAVASTGENLGAQVSPVFGRCSYFVFVNVEDGEIKDSKPLENPAISQSGGAGIKAAEIIANEKADIVISGAVGPNAFDVLKQFGIKVYKIAAGSVEHNVEYFLEGKLEEIQGPEAMKRGRGMGRGMGQRR